MTEEEWLTRCGFHRFEELLSRRASVRQSVLVVAAWVRRFVRYWADLPAFWTFPEMNEAIAFLERWADGSALPLELGEVVKNIRDASRCVREALEDNVDDNDSCLKERVIAAVAEVIDFVCEMIPLCSEPTRSLIDALTVLGDRTNSNLPQFVLAREGRFRSQFRTPQQRLLDCLESVLRAPSEEVAAEVHPHKNAIYDEEGEAEQRIMHDIFGNPFRPVSFSPSWCTDTAVTLARQMYDSRDFSAMPILADALQDAGCDNDDILSHCRDVSFTHVRGCWVVDLVLDKS